jgi:hypothetical protein
MEDKIDGASSGGAAFGIVCTLLFAAVLFSGLWSPAGPIAHTQATQDISRDPSPASN